jgi:RNA polymerase sigma factor (sigma-70 family)
LRECAAERMDLYLRYGPALVRKARRLLGNDADAQDIVQALFVRLLAEGMLAAEEHHVDLPYLYRAVTHNCLTWLRDHKNRARLLERQAPALQAQTRTRCDELALGQDLLLKLLAELSERQSAVLVYRFFDDCSQDEIAELLQTSRKTIGKDLAEVRAAVLRLQQEGDA